MTNWSACAPISTSSLPAGHRCAAREVAAAPPDGAAKPRQLEFDLEEGIRIRRWSRVVTDPYHPLSFSHMKKEAASSRSAGGAAALSARCAAARSRWRRPAPIFSRARWSAAVLRLIISGVHDARLEGRQVARGVARRRQAGQSGRLNDLRHIIYKSADAPCGARGVISRAMMREGLRRRISTARRWTGRRAPARRCRAAQDPTTIFGGRAGRRFHRVGEFWKLISKRQLAPSSRRSKTVAGRTDRYRHGHDVTCYYLPCGYYCRCRGAGAPSLKSWPNCSARLTAPLTRHRSRPRRSRFAEHAHTDRPSRALDMQRRGFVAAMPGVALRKRSSAASASRRSDESRSSRRSDRGRRPPTLFEIRDWSHVRFGGSKFGAG